MRSREKVVRLGMFSWLGRGSRGSVPRQRCLGLIVTGFHSIAVRGISLWIGRLVTGKKRRVMWGGIF